MVPAEHIRLCISPFENLSQEAELDIFCRSFSADLLTELSKFRQFWVTTSPPTECALPKYHQTVLPDYVITGNFRMDNYIVRINVQLLHHASQQMVWGNRFEGRLHALSDIQEALLIEVVGVLQQEINADLISKMRKRPRIEFSAYEHWLHGMEELKRGSVASDNAARAHFEQAIAIQPDYALAFTGMSLSYFNEWSCQLWDKWELAQSGAFTWAQKAIELDDRNYVAAMVLGKIFLYDGAYQTAEYYLRQSLALNPNDPDTLIQIASYFVYLGYEKEAEDLYERCVRLNPVNAHKYHPYAVFIYFEKGDFEKAATMIRHLHNWKWADAEVYFAATYYYLQRFEKMREYWDLFIETYGRLIAKGKPVDIQEAIGWIRKINPHKNGGSHLEDFLHFMEQGKKPQQETQKDTRVLPLHEYVFAKEGAAWRMCFDGTEAFLPEVKGFFDIARFLSVPRKLFHCAELMGSAIDAKGEKVFDQKAKKQYEQKLLRLQNAMQEAEHHADFDTLEKLQDEYDNLVEHLSQSLGLRGKVREAGNPVEKARAAVTWRIRHAIARIEAHHPWLGAHLGNAIKTGTFCSYQPDRALHWMVISEDTVASLTM
jgi:TolB-like protein/tetratricopeptide (TPR) repeat protein